MNIVITAGGTREGIDEVRYITNMSSGKLGSEIYEDLSSSIPQCKIFYIHVRGAILPNIKRPNSEFIEVTDTNSVKEAVEKVIKENKINLFIHSMAISDYTVNKIFTMDDILNAFSDRNPFERESGREAIENIVGIDKTTKISSNSEEIFISMKKTPKIIDEIKKLDKKIFLISFKLLNNVPNKELIDVAHKQLIRTNSNIVIANDLAEMRKEGAHKAYVVKEDATFKPLSSKKCISNEIVRIAKAI